MKAKRERWWLYELKSGLCVASGDGFAEAYRYSRQYAQDGPVYLSLGRNRKPPKQKEVTK